MTLAEQYIYKIAAMRQTMNDAIPFLEYLRSLGLGEYENNKIEKIIDSFNQVINRPVKYNPEEE